MKGLLVISLFLLFLSCSSRTQEQDEFTSTKELTFVFEKEGVKSLPDRIGLYKNLEKLTVQEYDGGGWTVYPPLSSWKDIIDRAEPNALTSEIGQLTRLKTLSLLHLRITQLPESFSALKSLDTLDLSMNYLTISDELDKLKKLPNLKYIDIRGNKIDTLQILQWEKENPSLIIKYSNPPPVDLSL